MTKRFRFVTTVPGVGSERLAEALRRAGALGAHGPPDVRPRRATVSICCGTTGHGAPAPVHDAVTCEWFADGAHLTRFEGWLATEDGAAVGAVLDGVLDAGASPVIVATEEVRRGAPWLEHRWRAGRTVWKHMALAVRVPGLSPAEATARWRAQAGQVGGSGGKAPTPIPEEIRGRAYVQNHPVSRAGGAWAYDAVNEVYFDDRQGLDRRVAWFAAHAALVADDGIFGRSWFLATCETLCHPVGG